MCMAAIMSSCHIYKSYDRPETIDASGIYRDPNAEASALATTDTTNMGNLPWQEVFRDVKLQALIEEGLANNVDLQAAILRVEEAKVMLTAAKLSYLPSINLAPQGTLSSFDNSKPSQTYQLPVAASWEIDLFGKLLNAKRGQRAAYLQSQYSQQAVRSQIICGIANMYYSLLMLDRQVQITSETVDIYKENVRAMEAMKVAGNTTEAGVAQMRAAYSQVQASLLDLKRQVRETENSLCVLLAKAPQPIDRSTLDEQVMPEELTVGVPLQLLENRPDVKIAEMTLASAYYSTNQARSAFYPNITLSGTAGWTNSAGAMIVNPNNREILFHKALEKDDALKILKLGEERSVTICLWCENQLFVNRIDERVNKYKRLSGVEPILINSKEALAEKGVTKILWYDEAEKIKSFQEALQKESFNEVTFCTSKPEFLEFFNSGVSKAAAMEFLGKLYGIKREEMIAIGDGDNDLAMIEYAGLGISMENGSEKVKKAAAYITASNDNEGVALAIEKFILNHI